MGTFTKVLLWAGGIVIAVLLINYLRLLAHSTQWMLFILAAGGVGLFFMVRSMHKEFLEGG